MERQEQIEQEEPYTKIPMPEPYLENMYKSLTEYPKKRLVDIDKVCDDILMSTTGYNSSLPFGKHVGKAKINEQVTRKVVDPDNGYDIDDDLLELAGLK
jgi:hypothetical protein